MKYLVILVSLFAFTYGCEEEMKKLLDGFIDCAAGMCEDPAKAKDCVAKAKGGDVSACIDQKFASCCKLPKGFPSVDAKGMEFANEMKKCEPKSSATKESMCQKIKEFDMKAMCAKAQGKMKEQAAPNKCAKDVQSQAEEKIKNMQKHIDTMKTVAKECSKKNLEVICKGISSKYTCPPDFCKNLLDCHSSLVAAAGI